MRRKKDTVNSRKRARIMKAGEEIFFEQGFRKTTVEEICRKAGASRMTFYKYFANKKDLFRTVWDRIIDDSYGRLYEIDELDIPFHEKMSRILRYKMELLGRISPELIGEVLRSSPELGDFLIEAQQRSFKQFLDYMKKAQDRGEMRRIRPEFVVAVLRKMRELAEDEDLRKLYGGDLEFIEELNSFFFFGIIPHDGVEER